MAEEEKAVFRRLAVFRGSFALEAAEAVCSGGDLSEWEIIELLTSLVEKSLVVYQPEEDRYRLLETIRQYLLDRVEREGGEAALRGAHLDYFVLLAETAEPQFTGPKQAGWMDRLESDQDNLRAALSYSVAAPHNPRRVESGLRIAGALGR